MEYTPDEAQASVRKVAQSLLSRDPVIFNSTINSTFDGRVTYSGRGLKISGASQLKHAAWLFNVVDGGKPATIKESDVGWDASSTTATITTTRTLRPRGSPMSFSLPVKTILRFNAEDSPNVDGDVTQPRELYVTSFEEDWPLDSFIKGLPVISKIYLKLWVPIVTFIVLAIANLAFALDARLSSYRRHSITPKAEAYTKKAENLPKGFGKGFQKGFETGVHIASGAKWVVARAVRLPLRATEITAQTSTKVANYVLPSTLQLPWPYIYEENSSPAPSDAGKKPSLPEASATTDTSLEKLASKILESNQRPSSEKPGVSGDAHPNPLVTVGPSLDGIDGPKVFDAPATQGYDGGFALPDTPKKSRPSSVGSGSSMRSSPKPSILNRIELPTAVATTDVTITPAEGSGPSLPDPPKKNGGGKKKKRTAGRGGNP